MAKLLFIQNIEFEFLGPMYISAFVGSAHECRMVIGSHAKDFELVMETFKPDVVGFPVMTGQHRWALECCRELKKRYSFIAAFGGPHATFFPEIIDNDAVDIVCRGEGEEAVKDLLDAIAAGGEYSSIANFWVKKKGEIHKNDVRRLKDELDAMPFPDRTLYSSTRAGNDTSIQKIITSRGCPFQCSFCFEESMRELYRGKGSYVRVRSVDNVIAELRLIQQAAHPRVFYFCDDVFGVNKKWLYSFLEIYKKEIGQEFICLVRADIVASDPDYARKLKDAGCKNVFFGIETGSEHLRNEILRKNLRDHDIYAAATQLHEAGLKFRAYNIIGLPDETVEDAYKTLEMNIAIKTDYPWCSLFTPYPRTALAEYAIEKGCLDPGFSADTLSQSFFIDSPLRLKDRGQIENIQKFFQTAVLWPAALPIIKLLVHLPPNIFFRLWFGLIYFYTYLKSEHRSLWQTTLFALRNFSSVIAKG
ncbi:MAG: radical SAM protein [Endomicrobiales bacterium]|jgi:radical SAM superfamily enzyme YgiQ (UPF0313 family)